MTDGKAEEAKARVEALKKEYETLVGELAKKKAEISGLASGYEKYKDAPAMAAQLEGLIKKRAEELSTLDQRIDALGRSLKQANAGLNRLFAEMKARTREKAIPKPSPVIKIAETPAVEKMLNRAFEKKPPVREAKPQPAPPPQKAEIKKEEPKKEAEIKAKPEAQKAGPSGDLYDKAAREAKAQEEYLKKMGGGRKDYGAA